MTYPSPNRQKMLLEACQEMLDAMELKESIEKGKLHLGKEAMQIIWNSAKKSGRDAIAEASKPVTRG